MPITTQTFTITAYKCSSCFFSACKQFDCSHTGDNIAQELFRICCDFGIEHKVKYVLSGKPSKTQYFMTL